MESMREAFEMSFLHNHLCGQWHWTLHLSKCFICLWWRGWLSCAWACSLVKLNRVRCVCRHNLSQMFSLSPIVEKFKQYSICVGNKRVTLLIQCRGNLVRSLCSPSGWTFSAPSTDTNAHNTSVNLNAKSKSQLRIKTVQLLTWNSYLISRYQWIPTIRQIVVERFGMNGLNFGVIWRQQSGPSGAQAFYGESIASIQARKPFMIVFSLPTLLANHSSLSSNHW